MEDHNFIVLYDTDVADIVVKWVYPIQQGQNTELRKCRSRIY